MNKNTGVRYTLKDLNFTLGFLGAELLECDGYFCFVPAGNRPNSLLFQLDNTSVTANNLHQLGYQDWLDEYVDLEKQISEL